MKKYIQQILALMMICIIGSTSMLQAQSIYKMTNAKENDMKLSGISALHNWSLETKTFTSEAQFGFKPGNEHQLASVNSLTFSVAVVNLKSGKKGLDKDAHNALKADPYRNIFYTQLLATITPAGGNKSHVKTEGNLNIAGVTKKVSINVDCIVNKDGTITATGSYKLKMTDYGVKPPSLLFGTVKTSDDVALTFTLVYKK
jgi:polyisoprenoid-binding protein YceI